MKRIWVFLMLFGLIAAFSTSAEAVDLKFSGEYYAAGMYMDKTDLRKDHGPSTAFYYQRLRVRTDFIVAPGLTLITRFDAMERAWGAAEPHRARGWLQILPVQLRKMKISPLTGPTSSISHRSVFSVPAI